MKKALIYNPFWDTMGGGERYTATFIRMLLDSGWTVDILWPKNLSLEIENTFGIDLSRANWVNKTFTFTSTIHYDLLFWLSDGSLPVSLAKKTIIHMQFPFTGIGGRSPVNLIKSRFYTFVVNSGFTKQFIDREFNLDSYIIHPPVGVEFLQPAVKQKSILYVGRFSGLTQKKGQEILLEVFSRFHRQIPGWKLILAGGTAVGTDPVFMRGLRQKSAKLPVDLVTDPKISELRKLYARSSIFWSAAGYGIDEKKHPSRVEHFGISLVEAMASGCVPVATGLGGHREIITQGVDGFLYDRISELTDYTLQLIKNNQMLEQLSKSAIAKSKMFSTGQFNSKFSALI